MVNILVQGASRPYGTQRCSSYPSPLTSNAWASESSMTFHLMSISPKNASTCKATNVSPRATAAIEPTTYPVMCAKQQHITYWIHLNVGVIHVAYVKLREGWNWQMEFWCRCLEGNRMGKNVQLHGNVYLTLIAIATERPATPLNPKLFKIGAPISTKASDTCDTLSSTPSAASGRTANKIAVHSW